MNENTNQAAGSENAVSSNKAAGSEKTLSKDKAAGSTRPAWVRVAAVLVVILLTGMVIATVICAFAGADRSIIMGLLMCDLIIPILIWVFLFITHRLKKQRKEA